jgi:hypothetical protein
MTASSWKDWKNDCTVQASDIAISDQMISEFRLLGVLLHQPGLPLPRDSGAAAVQALQNLGVTDPVPSVTEDGVVYLIARGHLKTCVLAIDMRKNTVQGVAEFSTENESSEDVMCSPCTISSV